jgi:hypothetical protein
VQQEWSQTTSRSSETQIGKHTHTHIFNFLLVHVAKSYESVPLFWFFLQSRPLRVDPGFCPLLSRFPFCTGFIPLQAQPFARVPQVRIPKYLQNAFLLACLVFRLIVRSPVLLDCLTAAFLLVLPLLSVVFVIVVVIAVAECRVCVERNRSQDK